MPNVSAIRVATRYRVAKEERGVGGLIFDFDGGFSLRTTPTDPPYNQTYTGSILMDTGGVKPYRAALQIVLGDKDHLMRLKRIREVQDHINSKVEAQGLKAPRWHTYHMPD